MNSKVKQKVEKTRHVINNDEYKHIFYEKKIHNNFKNYTSYDSLNFLEKKNAFIDLTCSGLFLIFTKLSSVNRSFQYVSYGLLYYVVA